MESPLEKTENVTRGCLKLNDKIYPVYEGHNTVGRNPDAVINIKNLAVSKHHAVITIVEGDAHYISDFKSSNGTFLDSNKLIPLQLYKLNNGASIKFGEVFCTYKKLDVNEVVRKSLDESQQCSASFYGSGTQEMCLPNVPDGINFNEMPTQAFPEKSLSINELPTQIFYMPDHDSSSNDSIDFVTMKKASESQAFGKTNGENKSDTSLQNSFPQSDTDDDLVAPVELSNEIGETSEVDQVSSGTSLIQPVGHASRKIEDSNAEDEPLSQIQPVKIGKRTVLDSESDSDTEEYVSFPQNNRSKYHISDDSETDIDDDDKNEKSLNIDLAQHDKSNAENTSMEGFNLRLSESVGCPDEELEGPKKIKRKELPEDHIYCQSLRETQDTQHVEEKSSENVPSDPQIVDEDKEGNGKPEVASKVTEPDVNNTVENQERPDENLEDGFDQLLEKSDVLVEDKDTQATCSLPFMEEQDRRDEKEKTDFHMSLEHKVDLFSSEGNKLAEEQDVSALKDVFSQSTETLDFDEENPKNIAESTKKEDDDELFLQPTQVLDTCAQKESKSAPENEEDDIFLQPTQSLENLHGGDKLADEHFSPFKKPKDIATSQALLSLLSEDEVESASSMKESVKENEDNLDLPPTQALEFLHRGDNSDEIQPDKISMMAMENEDLFLPPTQDLERLLSEDKVDKEDLEGQSSSKKDVFSPPQLFKTPSPAKKASRKQILPDKATEDEDDDDSFILQPTQALEVMHKDEEHFNKVEDQLHEIFASQSLLCTQQLVDVLEVSRSDEIIEDSIVQETEKSFSLPSLGFTKAQPISEESVKEILCEGLADEENRRRSQSAPRTFSKKQSGSEPEMEKIRIDKQSDGDKMKETDGGNKGQTVRRGRSKRTLSFGDHMSKDDATTSKSVSNEDNMRRSPRKQTLISSTSQDPAVDDVKKIDVTDEKVQIENKNENKETRKGNRRNQKATSSGDTEASVDQIPSETTNDEKRNTRRTRGQNVTSSKSEELASGLGEIKKGKEDAGTSKSASSEDNTRRSRRKQTLTSSNYQDPVVDDVKTTEVTVEKVQNEDKIEDVKEIRRGSRRNQKATDSGDAEAGVDQIPSETTNDEKGNSRRTRGQSVTSSKSEELASGLIEINKAKEEARTSKSASSEDSTRRSRRKQTLASSNYQDPVVDDVKTTEVAVEKVLNDDMNEDVKEIRRGNRRNQKATDSGDTKGDAETKNEEETTSKRTRGQSQTFSNSEESTSGDKEANTGRGRRKQNVRSDVRESSIESGKSNSQSSSNDGEKNKRRTKKAVEEDSKETETKENKAIEVRGRGRRKQNLVDSNEHDSNSEVKEDSQSSIDDSEGNKRRGRKQTKGASLEREEKTGTETDSSSSEGLNKRTKRKKEGSDKKDETPAKKKVLDEDEPSVSTRSMRDCGVVSSLRKRASDSEDDFVSKVPKIITPVKKTSARLRKSKIEEQNEASDEVITVSSASSKSETVISVSSATTIEESPARRRLSANSRRQKKEDEERNKLSRTPSTSILATPERSRRVLKPKVVFTMMDDPGLESLIRQLGGSVVETVDACTVLVTQNVKRSLKLLCAVAQGKPVCSPEWLRECKRKFAFVDPWDYILVDKEAEEKWNFSLRESINRSTKTKLLENYTFQLIVNNAADVLKGAIEACGGKCVTRNLPKCDTQHLVIVSSENNRSKFSKIVKQNSKIIVVEAEAIFDGTLRQEFKFNDHLIT